MLSFILFFILSVSVTINVLFYKKIIKQSDFITKLADEIDNATETMIELDRLGAFQADDEVGYVFTTLKDVVVQCRANIYTDNQDNE